MILWGSPIPRLGQRTFRHLAAFMNRERQWNALVWSSVLAAFMNQERQWNALVRSSVLAADYENVCLQQWQSNLWFLRQKNNYETHVEPFLSSCSVTFALRLVAMAIRWNTGTRMWYYFEWLLSPPPLFFCEQEYYLLLLLSLLRWFGIMHAWSMLLVLFVKGDGNFNQNTQEIKRTLFDKTEQDKTRKFSM